MSTRKRHPNKEIEAAIQHAEANGWDVQMAPGHAFAVMRCPQNDAECRCGEFCQTSIWSTPKNPEGLARKLRRIVNKCIHVD